MSHAPFIECVIGETKVLETRIVGNNIRRRRECETCKSRFTTMEIAVDEYESAVNTANRFEPLARTLDQFLEQHSI